MKRQRIEPRHTDVEEPSRPRSSPELPQHVEGAGNMFEHVMRNHQIERGYRRYRCEAPVPLKGCIHRRLDTPRLPAARLQLIEQPTVAAAEVEDPSPNRRSFDRQLPANRFECAPPRRAEPTGMHGSFAAAARLPPRARGAVELRQLLRSWLRVGEDEPTIIAAAYESDAASPARHDVEVEDCRRTAGRTIGPFARSVI